MALPFLIFAVASAAAQVGQARTAGRILEREAELEGEQAELGAIQREADRKERLAEALASQNAEAGAKGIRAFEGSPLTILEQDIRKEKTATERDRFLSTLGSLSGRFRAKTGASSLKQQAGISLLQQGANVAIAGAPAAPAGG
jgi:hypothetical protein